MTTMDDLMEAWKGMRKLANKLGFRLADFRVRANYKQLTLWHHLVDDKAAAILFVNYKTWNELLPKKSGDVDFERMHAVCVMPDFVDGNVKKVLVYDGLCDGRKDMPSGVTAPKGPQWIPWEKLIKCAEDYTSGSGITFASAKKSEKIKQEEDDHEKCKGRIASLFEQLGDTKRELDSSKERIAVLEKQNSQLTKNVADLAGIRDRAQISANLIAEDLAKAELALAGLQGVLGRSLK
jgi:hypothetical protein